MNEHSHVPHPPGAGGSSLAFLDLDRILGLISLKEGDIFLDLACGKGEYSIAASKILGDEGMVYAADLWEEGISSLRDNIRKQGIRNIKTILGDVGKTLPIDDRVVDACLMATVLHDLKRGGTAGDALREVARVLKESGTLAIIEFHKVDGPPGPPADIRLDPAEVLEMVTPYGFRMVETENIGKYHYMMRFKKK